MAMAADRLLDVPGTLKAILQAERARAARLEQIIKELRRHRFGRRAETLPEDQCYSAARARGGRGEQ
jgi:transposase